MEVALYIAHFSSISILIPLVFAVIQWRRIPAEISSLRWLLVVSLIADSSELLLSTMGYHNHWVGSTYLFIQFAILLYVFSSQFENKAMMKYGTGVLILSYLTGLILSLQLSASTVYVEAVANLVLILVPIAFFYKLLNELKVINIHRLPILWICFATLFYYSGNLFLFLARDLLAQVPESYGLSWILHNILNVTKNVLFAVALWQNYRTLKSST